MNDLQDSTLGIKLNFENPELVSLDYTARDKLKFTFLDEIFFSRTDQPIGISPGEVIEMELRPLLTDEEIEALDATKEVIDKTAQTLVLTQALMTILISISLKSMWNLVNVLQVLVFTRTFTPWPTFINDILMHLEEVLYLRQISDYTFDYGKSKFEVVQDMTKDEFLNEQGIQ